MPVDSSEQHDTSSAVEVGPDGTERAVVAGTPVVVRRHAGVSALVGAAASAVAIAYFWRASDTGGVLDWALFAVMAVIAGTYLSSLVDARTPLLVADDLGVRIRLGDEWRGLPWEAIGQVVVRPRRGPLRDGRLVLSPRSLARALEGLDTKARRHVALNQKMYGAALAVPVGTTTRVSTSGAGSVADAIAALAMGRADVVELDPRTLEVVDRQLDAGESVEQPTAGGPVPGRGEERQTVKSARGPSAEPLAESAAEPATESASVEEPAVPARREVFPRVHEPQAARIDVASSGETTTQTAAGPDAPSAEGPVEDATGGVATRSPRRSILGGIGTIVSRVAKGRSHDIDTGPESARTAPADAETAGSTRSDAPTTGQPTAAEATEAGGGEAPGAPLPLAPPAALRETRPGLRAEATIDLPTAGSAALDPSLSDDESGRVLPEGRELRRPGSVDLVFERVELDDRVRPISSLGDPVAPLVIDDYVTEPAYDPVIGPELTAARTRLGLSVDDLAERTRIRPHVIESIEVDDFAPCGGDFYARGHLRTLARILGKDPGPLLEKFEERYATAPINARRVFEAELATGMTGSMRSTVGGPSWGLMVGVVLCLVIVWGVLRLFTTEPVDLPSPSINGAAVVQTVLPGHPVGSEGRTS